MTGHRITQVAAAALLAAAPVFAAQAAEGPRVIQAAMPAAGPAIHTADPAQVVRQRLEASCTERLSTGRYFEADAQLDGTAGADRVFDYGQATCGGEPMMEWCGSAGCVKSVWLDDGNGTYREVWEGAAWDVSADADAQTIVIGEHGSACDVPGYQGCYVEYRVSSSGLTQVDAEPAQP